MWVHDTWSILEPRHLRCQCSAPPFEPLGQMRAGRNVGSRYLVGTEYILRYDIAGRPDKFKPMRRRCSAPTVVLLK